MNEYKKQLFAGYFYTEEDAKNHPRNMAYATINPWTTMYCFCNLPSDVIESMEEGDIIRGIPFFKIADAWKHRSHYLNIETYSKFSRNLDMFKVHVLSATNEIEIEPITRVPYEVFECVLVDAVDSDEILDALYKENVLYFVDGGGERSYYTPMLKSEAVKYAKGQLLQYIQDVYLTVDICNKSIPYPEKYVTVEIKSLMFRVPASEVLTLKDHGVYHLTFGQFIKIV